MSPLHRASSTAVTLNLVVAIATCAPAFAQTVFTPNGVIGASANGFVGIGTSNPQDALHVVGGITSTGSITTVGGHGYYNGMGTVSGAADANDLDFSRPHGAGNGAFRINGHQGVSMSAHSYYGGIRFYNQGYSASTTNPYDSTSGAALVMSLTDGNVGIGTATPGARLDVRGPARFDGYRIDPSVGYDTSTYFAPQAYFEANSFPYPLVAGSAPTFVTVSDATVPFGKVALSNGLTEFASDFIPVQPGEKLYGEIWTMRPAGASGNEGHLYFGIARYDKDKNPIAGNAAFEYFVAPGAIVPSNGTWTRYKGTTTLPTAHSPFNGSDGGAVRYIRAYIIVNYHVGSIPTYWGGALVRRVAPHRDSGDVVFNGNVTIGTDSTAGKLSVRGEIVSTEIRCSTTGADYVFADDYALKPLSEVEQHIKQHKHLPGIPSAAEMQANGVGLADMQTRLLAKLEELTLHVISQNKRIEKLEQENRELRGKQN